MRQKKANTSAKKGTPHPLWATPELPSGRTHEPRFSIWAESGLLYGENLGVNSFGYCCNRGRWIDSALSWRKYWDGIYSRNLGGPPGVAIAAGQFGINTALLGYSAYHSHRNFRGELDAARSVQNLIGALRIELLIEHPERCGRKDVIRARPKWLTCYMSTLSECKENRGGEFFPRPGRKTARIIFV